MVVFAGPTGSGKTSTIYKLASELSEDQIIMTIEDPIEISSESFLQLQINEAAGLNYAELIKVGLRHRPDAFIIGEIRDSKTANAAIQAALSGHLVLTTIHAQSPSGVIKRLKNLGIDNEYIDQALTGVAYQRLVTTKNDDQQALLVSHPASELNQGEYDWSRWQLYLKGGVDDG
ncbi:GspE family protein [Lentilactobacillus kosonis]|uniref:Late competence protein ComGA, access of DNA to ComEA n=1 Tax=Lentilactobacillus kosonis TaxID=2810561 RepID=A0A401FLR7_9LACO|nr:GspE family protein [Lentilactobacillus kosonis]GAY73161.1 late competence protein ComGA, access of DNA to ComEA [Lentilactobacillus kosonis]